MAQWAGKVLAIQIGGGPEFKYPVLTEYQECIHSTTMVDRNKRIPGLSSISETLAGKPD